MSHIDEIRQEIKKIAQEGQEVEKKVLDYTQKSFSKTMKSVGEKSADMTQSTKDILEGVEKGLADANHESREILAKVSAGLVDVTRDISGQTLEAVHSYAQDAKQMMEKALKKSDGEIEKIEKSAKEGMEKAHAKLYQQTQDVLLQVETVSKAIYDYSTHKATELGQTIAPKMEETSNKAHAYAKELEAQGKEFSKTFLSHSKEKTANWLRKMAALLDDKKPKG